MWFTVYQESLGGQAKEAVGTWEVQAHDDTRDPKCINADHEWPVTIQWGNEHLLSISWWKENIKGVILKMSSPCKTHKEQKEITGSNSQ